MNSQKIFHNANKFAYIVKEYPGHSVQQILGLIQVPAIELNTAHWYATDAGWVTEIYEALNPAYDPKDPKSPATVQRVDVAKLPDEWNFGPVVADLEDMFIFAFANLGTKETDLEENYLSNWTMGYAAHDVMVALRHLMETKQLANYVIEDGDSSYSFYTLYENRDKLWGRKQFKVDPLAEPEKTDNQDGNVATESEK